MLFGLGLDGEGDDGLSGLEGVDVDGRSGVVSVAVVVLVVMPAPEMVAHRAGLFVLFV